MQMNTLLLGIIAAVAIGATVVWVANQPSAAERRQAEFIGAADAVGGTLDRIDENNSLVGD